MAQVTITLVDAESDTVDVNFTFDPPVRPTEENTAAQAAGLDLLALTEQVLMAEVQRIEDSDGNVVGGAEIQ